MERLKAGIPDALRTLILSTPAADLAVSCAALARHFSTTPEFNQLLKQLLSTDVTSCAKDPFEADNWKREGNAAFGSHNYGQALSCYTKALRYAPLASKEKEQGTVYGPVFVNRATTLHKLGLLESAMRDCDRALRLSPSYSKAWYRRGCVKCDLRDFVGAANDMEKALACESTPGAHLQVKNKLTQIELLLRSAQLPEWHEICPSSAISKSKQTGACSNAIKQQQAQGTARVKRHWTKEKGWNLQTTEDLTMGSLIFQEDPFAAIVLKSCRDTHCHFCFEVLPADPVPCRGCAIATYCSDFCRSRAFGSPSNMRALCIQSQQKVACVEDEVLAGMPNTPPSQHGTCEPRSHKNVESAHERSGEHVLECGGSSWAAALPTEAVLAARMLSCVAKLERGVLIRSTQIIEGIKDTSATIGASLCHHYDEHDAHSKLELHVMGIVVAYCVNQSASPLTENWTNVAATASKLVGLMAQVRVNAMAIFRMSSPEVDDSMGIGNALCTVEQVKVARGIYVIGSWLNHSCVPNVHASFMSGRLFIRALAGLKQGSNLELCYGPQVGALPQLERKRVLRESYFFDCTCPACSAVSLPDLFLRSFRCARPDCMGVVLGPDALPSGLHTMADSQSKDSVDSLEDEIVVAEESLVSSETAKEQAAKLANDSGMLGEEFAKLTLVQNGNIGSCLVCGTVVKVKAAHDSAARASSYLERLETQLVKAGADCGDLKWTLKGAAKALESLRETVHAYSEQLAKGEDVLARLLCNLDRPLVAVKHSLKAIEILERLFGTQNIVVGNEYLKLASVAILGQDMECARRSLAVVDQIFTVHYGSDYRTRLPYVARIQQLVQ